MTILLDNIEKESSMLHDENILNNVKLESQNISLERPNPFTHKMYFNIIAGDYNKGADYYVNQGKITQNMPPQIDFMFKVNEDLTFIVNSNVEVIYKGLLDNNYDLSLKSKNPEIGIFGIGQTREAFYQAENIKQTRLTHNIVVNTKTFDTSNVINYPLLNANQLPSAGINSLNLSQAIGDKVAFNYLEKAKDSQPLSLIKSKTREDVSYWVKNGYAENKDILLNEYKNNIDVYHLFYGILTKDYQLVEKTAQLNPAAITQIAPDGLNEIIAPYAKYSTIEFAAHLDRFEIFEMLLNKTDLTTPQYIEVPLMYKDYFKDQINIKGSGFRLHDPVLIAIENNSINVLKYIAKNRPELININHYQTALFNHATEFENGNRLDYLGNKSAYTHLKSVFEANGFIQNKKPKSNISI